MATDKKTAREKELDQIISSIARYAVIWTYTDETEVRRHLANAIDELREASDKLIEREG